MWAEPRCVVLAWVSRVVGFRQRLGRQLASRVTLGPQVLWASFHHGNLRPVSSTAPLNSKPSVPATPHLSDPAWRSHSLHRPEDAGHMDGFSSLPFLLSPLLGSVHLTFFSVELVIKLRALCLKEALYLLSHTSSWLCFSLF
jgi:hypothetical protein